MSLEQERQNARDIFHHLGYPTRKTENWKYTNVRDIVEFIEQNNARSAAAYTLSINEIPGVTVVPLLQAIKDPRIAKTIFGLNYSASHHHIIHPFLALNSAYFNAGVVITLQKGVHLAEPLRIQHFNQASAASTEVRCLIIAEADVRADIEIHYQGEPNATYYCNIVQQFLVADRAHLNLKFLQDASQQAYLITHTLIQQASASEVCSLQWDRGGKIVRNDLEFYLQGERARCEARGLYQMAATQHVDNHVTCEHWSPLTQSRQFYRGVLQEKAHAVFNGRVFVSKEAHKSISQQLNNNLLLSSEAVVDTKPELEIYHDDVQCQHGATVGQLDADALFYLRSRGISEEAAKQLLLEGFMQEILN